MFELNTDNVIRLGLALSLVWVLRLTYLHFSNGLSRVPGPWLAKVSSLWRPWFVRAGDCHEGYRRLHERYGPIVRTAPHIVDISDPSAIPIIYGISSKFLKTPFYSTMAMVYEDKMMNSMFTAIDPAEHKALKRPVAQKFSMSSVRTLEYLVDPCTNIFTEAMVSLEGQVVDLGVWAQWYAFDVIGAITFEQRFGFMEKREDIGNVIGGIEILLKYAGIVGQVPFLHNYLLGSVAVRRMLAILIPSFNDPVSIVMEMVLKQIKEYDANDQAERADFLAYFRQNQKSTGEVMSKKDLMNHLMNNLLAGSDTTGISLRAVFYYVMRDKRVYKKLQQEIDEAHALGNLSPNITYAESLQLPYLQLCIKEAMRMHPGVSYPLERFVPAGGVELCGTYLSEGVIVGVNPAVIHRNRDVFGDDANEFRPERWNADEEKVKEMERSLLTFGAGVRTCIGKNISIMEMSKFVPQVLRQFDVEWASSEPDWQVKTYWFARQMGFLARFKQRKPQKPGVSTKK